MVPRIEDRYRLRPAFAALLRTVEGGGELGNLATLKSVNILFSRYITSRRDKFFDVRNMKIVMVEGDPLQQVFNLKAFHTSQANALVRNQLIIPLPSRFNTSPVYRPTVLSQPTPSIGPRITSPPTLVIPSGNRARHSEETDDDDSSMSSDFTEYDPDCSSAEDRSAVTHGPCIKVASSTDSDLDVDHVATPISFNISDNAYWAEEEGGENDMAEPGSDSDSPRSGPRSGHYRCTVCRAPSKMPSYCLMCFHRKQAWVPARRKVRAGKLKGKGSGRASSSVTADTSFCPSSAAAPKSQSCKICYNRLGNTAFLHGKLAHLVSCDQCAKRTWDKQAACPVCRRTVDRLVRVVQC